MFVEGGKAGRVDLRRIALSRRPGYMVEDKSGFRADFDEHGSDCFLSRRGLRKQKERRERRR